MLTVFQLHYRSVSDGTQCGIIVKNKRIREHDTSEISASGVIQNSDGLALELVDLVTIFHSCYGGRGGCGSWSWEWDW